MSACATSSRCRRAIVKDGPIFENVVEGDAVDVLKFPVPRHHELDTARFIGTADCVITKDPDEGWFNLGAYRSPRSMTARRWAARSPRASTAASTATSISSAASR